MWITFLPLQSYLFIYVHIYLFYVHVEPHIVTLPQSAENAINQILALAKTLIPNLNINNVWLPSKLSCHCKFCHSCIYMFSPLHSLSGTKHSIICVMWGYFIYSSCQLGSISGLLTSIWPPWLWINTSVAAFTIFTRKRYYKLKRDPS